MLLTTQYLDEADQLADRITVMGAGRVIAEGTSAELKSRLGGDRVIVTTQVDADPGALAELLGGTADPETRQVTVEAGPAGGTAALLAVVRALDARRPRRSTTCCCAGRPSTRSSCTSPPPHPRQEDAR